MKYPLAFLFTLLFYTSVFGQQERPYLIEPVLVGGLDSLYKAIENETTLNEACNLTGKVYVTYMILENGETDTLKVIRGLCDEADSIAIAIVRRLKYIPASRSGTTITVRKTIPIYFKRKR